MEEQLRLEIIFNQADYEEVNKVCNQFKRSIDDVVMAIVTNWWQEAKKDREKHLKQLEVAIGKRLNSMVVTYAEGEAKRFIVCKSPIVFKKLLEESKVSVEGIRTKVQIKVGVMTNENFEIALQQLDMSHEKYRVENKASLKALDNRLKRHFVN